MSDDEEIEIGDEVPTALYRLYDSAGSLLYVGITAALKARLIAHASSKPWWPRVDRKTVVWYLTRAEALAAEDRAIRNERPAFNQVGSPGSVASQRAARAAAGAIWGTPFPTAVLLRGAGVAMNRPIPADVGDLC